VREKKQVFHMLIFSILLISKTKFQNHLKKGSTSLKHTISKKPNTIPHKATNFKENKPNPLAKKKP